MGLHFMFGSTRFNGDKDGGEIMATMIVRCQSDECEAENYDWEDKDGTFWFKCVECGMDNEVVYKWW
jgi:hypothetical protein